MTTSLRADVFPATFTLERLDGTKQVLDRVRVVVTAGSPDRVLVYRDGANGPELAYSTDITNFEPPLTPQRLREAWAPLFTTYFANAEAGVVSFVKAGGCGCGSRLKSFNPFPSINSLAAS